MLPEFLEDSAYYMDWPYSNPPALPNDNLHGSSTPYFVGENMAYIESTPLAMTQHISNVYNNQVCVNGLDDDAPLYWSATSQHILAHDIDDATDRMLPSSIHSNLTSLSLQILEFARDMYDFALEVQQELALRRGDIGRLKDGEMGLFPYNYVEIIHKGGPIGTVGNEGQAPMPNAGRGNDNAAVSVEDFDVMKVVA
ncbi:hypothetical protein BC938DRAFT_471822 [Jimgerdemannia flammicorona]|uniref:Uncharacterized protein n=1 Tax=Jimgerdemannia flammicorona TaxID=994334 RepID=A0A433Q7B7_9FUNG|nr:hypothetical protein BC938DRAFT_471822 [Jimgerdemannia flammicorona]